MTARAEHGDVIAAQLALLPARRCCLSILCWRGESMSASAWMLLIVVGGNCGRQLLQIVVSVGAVGAVNRDLRCKTM